MRTARHVLRTAGGPQRQREDELRQREEHLRQREEQLRQQREQQQQRQQEEQLRHREQELRQREQQLTTCVDGGPHDFQYVAAENEKKSLVGGCLAMFMGTGGGAKAKSSNDKGQRVILYCRKCGKSQAM